MHELPRAALVMVLQFRATLASRAKLITVCWSVGIIPKRAPNEANRDVYGLGSIRHVRILSYCTCDFVGFLLYKHWASTQSIALKGSEIFGKDCFSLQLEFIRKPVRLVVM